MVSGTGGGLTPGERDRLDAIRATDSLADLVAVMRADSEHDAYYRAKREWFELRGREDAAEHAGGLPGDCVVVDGREFWVHGVTHADTDAERAFLREHVARLLDAGADVYCEQGIRPMYFADVDGVSEMDDYNWAMQECAELDAESHAADAQYSGLVEDVNALAARFRDAAFSLIDAGSDIYGPGFESALGDVASAFLMSHEDFATGRDFASFSKSKAAAENPERLADLQAYYRRAFLPPPLEREWLRRHDPELEIVTQARNERLADYAVYHADAARVHVIVGAAHQPGVTYYLERHRDGHRDAADFEYVE